MRLNGGALTRIVDTARTEGEAERQLAQEGDFLVRESMDGPGKCVLTSLYQGQPMHIVSAFKYGPIFSESARVFRLPDSCPLHVTTCPFRIELAYGVYPCGESKALVDPAGIIRTKTHQFTSVSRLINWHLQGRVPVMSRTCQVLQPTTLQMAGHVLGASFESEMHHSPATRLYH